MKSQSLIVQFILFFVIGLGVFLSLGNLFKFQSEIVRGDVINSSVELTNSFLSSNIISAVDSCKQCDSVSANIKLEKTVAGFFTEINLLKNGLNTSIDGQSFSSSIHNLNETISGMSGKVSSAKAITLMFNRTNNNLMIK
jgi:hypothetical protein